MRIRRVVSAWLIWTLVAAPLVRADNILISGVEMNPTIQGYLTALGHTSTIVTPGNFGTASFAGYDAIWLGWNSNFSGLAARQADLMSFMNAGGNVLAEVTSENFNPVTDYPFGNEINTPPPAHLDVARIVNASHPLVAGLTNASLSSWGNSTHGYYTSIGGFTGITDTGDTGEWTLLTREVGVGNLTFSAFDISFHIKNGSGPTGPTSAKGILLDNALTLADNASPVLAVTPTSINFGTVIQGASVASQLASIEETGGVTTTYNVGAAPAGFNVVGAGTSNISIGANTIHDHSVTLNTSTVGTFSGNLNFSSTGPDPDLNQDVALSGKVLAHASPTQSTNSVNLGTVITGAPTQTATATIGNADHPNALAGQERAGLEITGVSGLSGSLGATGVDPGDLIAANGSQPITFSGTTGTVGNFNQTLTVGGSDDTTIPGNTPVANTNYGVSFTVLDHSHASFSSSTLDVNPLDIDLGVVNPSGPLASQGFDVTNFEVFSGLTADLQYLGITGISGDLGTFDVTENGVALNDLIAGSDQAAFLAAIVNNNTLGEFSATYRLDFRDENLPGQGPLQSLFVNVSATVAPEPATLAVWSLLGLVLAGACWLRSRKRSARVA
jgi:hypothetical protein